MRYLVIYHILSSYFYLTNAQGYEQTKTHKHTDRFTFTTEKLSNIRLQIHKHSHALNNIQTYK